MRIAIYPSVLYGADFIVESIQSILPFVDEVFVVMMQKPWGYTEGVQYKNQWVPWPKRFDDTREKIAAINEPKISIVETQKDTPWNRWGFAAQLVCTDLCKPDEIMFIDPDCVFSEKEAFKTFGIWNRSDYVWAAPRQIELWKTPHYQIARNRSMVSFHRGPLSLVWQSVEESRPPTKRIDSTVYNLGFCVSEEAMRWKHLTAMAFSPVVGESIPNPDWFEEKWLRWTPETKNLEISQGSESSVPNAFPYLEVDKLPLSIKNRFQIP